MQTFKSALCHRQTDKRLHWHVVDCTNIVAFDGFQRCELYHLHSSNWSSATDWQNEEHRTNVNKETECHLVSTGDLPRPYLCQFLSVRSLPTKTTYLMRATDASATKFAPLYLYRVLQYFFYSPTRGNLLQLTAFRQRHRVNERVDYVLLRSERTNIKT